MVAISMDADHSLGELSQGICCSCQSMGRYPFKVPTLGCPTSSVTELQVIALSTLDEDGLHSASSEACAGTELPVAFS